MDTDQSVLIHREHNVDSQVMFHIHSRTVTLVAVMPPCYWSEINLDSVPVHSHSPAARDARIECLRRQADSRTIDKRRRAFCQELSIRRDRGVGRPIKSTLNVDRPVAGLDR